MELLSVGVARSVWLFDMNELNPAGKSIFPDALIWFGEKYSFQSYPRSIADADEAKKAFVFKTGNFQSGQDSIVVNLSLYSDGVVAESWASTEKTDAFIEDALTSASTKYGLTYRPDTVRTKQYVSEVNVRFDYPISNLNPRLIGLCNTLTSVFKQHGLPPFEFYGLGFSPDVTGRSYKPPGFSIERKVNAPYSENRFWSKSPFTTKQHLTMLEEFEKLLST